MLCDTSVDPKSTGMSLIQHLVLSSLRALCAGSLGRRCLRGYLSSKMRGLPGVGPRGAASLSLNFGSLGAALVLGRRGGPGPRVEAESVGRTLRCDRSWMVRGLK